MYGNGVQTFDTPNIQYCNFSKVWVGFDIRIWESEKMGNYGWKGIEVRWKWQEKDNSKRKKTWVLFGRL